MRCFNKILFILFIIINVMCYINCKEPDLKECIIDNNGKFKYIQIKVNNIENQNESKIIIRGTDIFTNFINNEINNNIQMKNNFSFEIIGGGKIIFDNKNKTIILYGYSTAYGPADHSLTSSIIKKYYPNYEIEIKYD